MKWDLLISLGSVDVTGMNKVEWRKSGRLTFVASSFMSLHDNVVEISAVASNGDFGVRGVSRSPLLGFLCTVIIISPFL